MVLLTTCPVSDRHVAAIQELAPDLEIRVFRSMGEASADLPDAEILLTYGEDLTPEHIARCTRLQWIMVISAGLELMPFPAITERKVLVTNAKGIHKGPMAEYTMGMILMFSRRFVTLYQNQQKHLWDRMIRIDELAGQTLGILGAGAIGSEIARKAKAFDMHVLGVTMNKRDVEGVDEMFDASRIDEVLSRSDYVVIAVPLTDQTEGMIGAREIALMKESAVLINIARGQVLEETALLQALRDGKIRGAGLDVFVEEPLPPTHPFWGLENVVLTPHLSSRSPKYMERAQEIFRHNLQVYLTGNGQMTNVIDTQKGY